MSNESSVTQELLCQLMISEERYQNFLNATTDFIFINKLNGLFIDANNAACNALGYTHKEITNMSVWDIEVGFSKETINELSLKLTQGPFNVEGRHKRKDGTTFPVDVRMGAFKSMGETMILAIVRDISDEKKKESTIKKLTYALEKVPSLVIIADKSGIIDYANTKAIEQTGYVYKEIIGQNLRMLQSDHAPKKIYQAMWDQLNNNKAWHGEIELKNKNGDRYWVSAEISPFLCEKDTEATHYLVIMEPLG